MPVMSGFGRNWIQALPVSGDSKAIPKRSGLYAYGVVKRCNGLPVSINWVYVGKAKNLRQRTRSHSPVNEVNPDLQVWLRTPPQGAELWVVEVDAKSLNESEQDLIRCVDPSFNRNHRPKDTDVQ